MVMSIDESLGADCAFDPEFGMKVLRHDGMAWGWPTSRELVDKVKTFPCDASDVMVLAYPKSGTNWMQIMLANLYDDWGTCAITEQRRVPQLEYQAPGFEGYEMSLEARPPRLMKCHLPADRMPTLWHQPMHRSKIICMTRNPKDVCVSFRHQLQAPFLEFDDDWNFWFRRFVDGKTIYGSWLAHTLGWHKYGEHDGVLHVSYEETRRDQVAVMKKVIAFIGKPVDAQRFADVMEKSRFENMKDSEFQDQINFASEAQRARFMRKGVVADWKNWFTVAQNEEFDEKIVKPLEAAGIHLDYE